MPQLSVTEWLLVASVALAWALLVLLPAAWAVTVSPRSVRVIVLCGVVILLVVQAVTFLWPPHVWLPDIPDAMVSHFGEQPSSWYWLERRGAEGNGWNLAPIYWVNHVTGTFLGERIIGGIVYFSMVWVLGAVLWTWYGSLAPVMIGVAALISHAPLLFVSRYYMGAEIVMMQLLLIAVVARAWSRLRGLALGAYGGVIAGLALLSYQGAKPLSLYLLWALGRGRRWVFVGGVMVMSAMLFGSYEVSVRTNQALPLVFYGFRSHVCPEDEGHARTFLSLIDPRYGGQSNVSAPGRQIITPLRQAASVLSIVPAWRWLVLAGVNLAPDLAGCGHGKSHRQMLVHLPLILAWAEAGWWVANPYLAAGISTVLLIDGYHQWFGWVTEPDSSYFPDLWPCEDPAQRPPWCPGDGKGL